MTLSQFLTKPRKKVAPNTSICAWQKHSWSPHSAGRLESLIMLMMVRSTIQSYQTSDGARNHNTSPLLLVKIATRMILRVILCFRQYNLDEKLVDVIHHNRNLKNNNINNLVLISHLEQLQEYFGWRLFQLHKEELRFLLCKYRKLNYSWHLISESGVVFSLKKLIYNKSVVVSEGRLGCNLSAIESGVLKNAIVPTSIGVASTWYPNERNSEFDVHHRNGNFLENHFTNLQWLSKEDHQKIHCSAVFKREHYEPHCRHCKKVSMSIHGVGTLWEFILIHHQ